MLIFPDPNPTPFTLPTQTGNSGKFLTTNGTVPSWGDVTNTLPSQGGNNGKFLKTDGANASWADVPAAPVTSVAGLTGAITGTSLNTALGARIRLAADTSFYVASTGNDGNTGLAIGSPWLTLQHAVSVITKNYDLNGYTVTVQVADGTYIAGANVTGYVVGQVSPINFVGNLVTPANCFINVTNSECFTSSLNADIWPRGFKVAATGVANNQGHGLAAYSATIRYDTIDFGACSNAQIFSSNNGLAINTGDYSISGGGSTHIYANGGQITNNSALTVTVTGTPAFSTAFAFSNFTSTIYAVGYTFIGGATGSRYAAQMNGVISTGGGGANYFPGNGAGSTATGGQYV